MSFRLHDPDALAVDFEQVIISVILFTVLFANQIMICSRSATHLLLVLSCLFNPNTLAAILNRSLFRLFVSWLFVSYFVNHILICFMSAAHLSPVSSPLHLWCVGLLSTCHCSGVSCIWHCLLTRHWFVKCQQHLYIGVILQYNSGSIAADFV